MSLTKVSEAFQCVSGSCMSFRELQGPGEGFQRRLKAVQQVLKGFWELRRFSVELQRYFRGISKHFIGVPGGFRKASRRFGPPTSGILRLMSVWPGLRIEGARGQHRCRGPSER